MFTLDDWKAAVTLAAGGRCAVCRTKPIGDFDHIVARSQGGPNSAQNLLPVCRDCHREKTENRLSWGLDSGILWVYRGSELLLRRPWPPSELAVSLLSEVQRGTFVLSKHVAVLSHLDDTELLDYVEALREHGDVSYHLQCLALAEAAKRQVYGTKMQFYQSVADQTGMAVSSVRNRTKVGQVFGERLLAEDVRILGPGYLEPLAFAPHPYAALERALERKEELGTYSRRQMQRELHLHSNARYCNYWTSEDGESGSCLLGLLTG